MPQHLPIKVLGADDYKPTNVRCSGVSSDSFSFVVYGPFGKIANRVIAIPKAQIPVEVAEKIQVGTVMCVEFIFNLDVDKLKFRNWSVKK